MGTARGGSKLHRAAHGKQVQAPETRNFQTTTVSLKRFKNFSHFLGSHLPWADTEVLMTVCFGVCESPRSHSCTKTH